MKSTFLPGLISRVNGSSGGNGIAEVNLGSVDLFIDHGSYFDDQV